VATGSTPSSGTDRPRPDPDEASEQRSPDAPASPPQRSSRDVDPARRAFFLEFGKQAVSAVGQVAGMADMASRSATAVAGELLGLDEDAAARPAFTRSGATTDPVVSAAPAGDDAFASAFRLTDEGLVLLDQRAIPERLDEVVARRGSDVAYYLRLGVARGGPLMAQAAAYGLALTAAERADAPAEGRDLELRRTERALVEARPSSRLVGWAVERMRGVADAAAPSTGGAELARLLRAEADAIAAHVSASQAAIAGGLASALSDAPDRALAVLLHGSQGALAGGLVGAGIGALARLRDEGRELHVFVTEGRPFMDGARLASWELRQADLEHRLIPDAAVAWLLAREELDAVLVSAEWVAANGDVGALLGSQTIAGLIAAMPTDRARPRLLVGGLAAARDPRTADGSAIPVELRPARDLAAYLADVPIRAGDALVPAADVIPAAAVDALITETDGAAGTGG
jgi:methylthioribose-1-phosphate isomerase